MYKECDWCFAFVCRGNWIMSSSALIGWIFLFVYQKDVWFFYLWKTFPWLLNLHWNIWLKAFNGYVVLEGWVKKGGYGQEKDKSHSRPNVPYLKWAYGGLQQHHTSTRRRCQTQESFGVSSSVDAGNTRNTLIYALSPNAQIHWKSHDQKPWHGWCETNTSMLYSVVDSQGGDTVQLWCAARGFLGLG